MVPSTLPALQASARFGRVVSGLRESGEHIFVAGDVAADDEKGRFDAVPIEQLEEARHHAAVRDRAQLVGSDDACVAVDVVRERVEIDGERVVGGVP